MSSSPRLSTICTRRKPIIRLRTPRRCDRPRLRCPPSDWRRHLASCWSWRARYTRNAGLSNGVETACMTSQGPHPLNSRRGKKNRGDLPGDGRLQSSVVGQIMAGATRLGPASTAVSYTLFGRKVSRSGFQERTKGAMNLDGKLWRPYPIRIQAALSV